MNNAVAHQNVCRPSFYDSVTSKSGYCEENAVWRQVGKSYKPGIIGLHAEIKDFVAYISPTHEERWVREIVVAKIKQTIYAQWPNCHVDVFGSSKTMLFLPTSDIDMVVFGKWENLPFRTLERIIRNSGVASHIKVLSRATVPIFKLTDADTGLHVDISFNMENSVRTADLICSYIKEFPYLPYLVFVLKQFILQRNLNEVWTGGISSYALLLMIISFLQHSVKMDSLEDVNFGVLLMDFFELYGKKFNYMTTAIRVRDGGSYVSKEAIQENMKPGSLPSILCIEDPLCPGNDVGRGSFGASQVQKVFANAYSTLETALSSNTECDASLLSRIVQISSVTENSRERVRCYARQLYLILPHFIYPALSGYKINWYIGEKTEAHHRPTAPTQRSSSKTCNLNGNFPCKTTKNEPIVVSAKGYSIQTPHLLWPYSPVHSCLYSPHAVVCDGRQTRPNAVPINPAQHLLSPFMFLLPDPLLAFPSSPFTVQDAFSNKNHETISSPLPECDSDSSGIINDVRSLASFHHDSSSEECKDAEITQPFSDSNKSLPRTLRSSSVHHQPSDLSSQLSPLRLSSSEQDVSLSERESFFDKSSPQPGSVSSEEADSAACSIDESGDAPRSSQVEKPQKQNRGRYSRRRRRPLRHCDKFTTTSDDFAILRDVEPHMSVSPKAVLPPINRWRSDFNEKRVNSSSKNQHSRLLSSPYVHNNDISAFQEDGYAKDCGVVTISKSMQEENFNLVKNIERKKMLRT